MFETLSLICLIAAVIILALLAFIDLRIKLLPDILVIGFAMLGLTFHSLTLFYYTDINDIAAGIVMGGGILLVIRILAARFYGQDALGLGDIKLMAAAGLWLGGEYVLIAVIAGALAGIIHGGALIVYNRLCRRETGPISQFSVPAGPGFIVGILLAALAKFAGLPHLLLS